MCQCRTTPDAAQLNVTGLNLVPRPKVRSKPRAPRDTSCYMTSQKGRQSHEVTKSGGGGGDCMVLGLLSDAVPTAEII